MTTIPSSTPARGSVRLRLFVSGATERSTRAVRNLNTLFARHPNVEFDLEVVDVYERPEAAREHQVVAIPTLVRLSPEPLARVIGDLGKLDRVEAILGLEVM